MTLAQEKIAELEKRNKELKIRMMELTIDNYKEKLKIERKIIEKRKV